MRVCERVQRLARMQPSSLNLRKWVMMVKKRERERERETERERERILKKSYALRSLRSQKVEERRILQIFLILLNCESD